MLKIQCFNITDYIAIISQLRKRQLKQLMDTLLSVLVLKRSSILLEKSLKSTILKNFASRKSVLQFMSFPRRVAWNPTVKDVKLKLFSQNV